MPEGSMMNPEPSDADRGDGEFGPPGAPFSLKKSRKNSSSGVPGDGTCASGAPLATGASVRLGMAALKDKVSITARITARGPNNATISLLHTSSRLRTLGLPGQE